MFETDGSKSGRKGGTAIIINDVCGKDTRIKILVGVKKTGERISRADLLQEIENDSGWHQVDPYMGSSTCLI